ncbi:MAG: site-2 protease family protein [Coriobacteriia bacterium]
MRFKAFRLGRVAGIPVEVDISWLIILVLVTASFSFEVMPALYPEAGVLVQVVAGLMAALLFFASLVAHEMSHSMVARSAGTRVERITLFVFGGVAQMDDEPPSAGSEFLMAAAGPALSISLSVLGTGAAVASALVGAPIVVWAPLQLAALTNLGLAVFNLFPGFPLDGGRMLRALLWRMTGDILWATKWASRAGQAIGWALVGGGLLSFAGSATGLLGGQDPVGSLWMSLVGWFLASMASRAYKEQQVRSRLAEIRVGDVMEGLPGTAAPVGPTARPLTGEVLASADEPLTRHLSLLGHARPDFKFVVNEGRVVGVLTRTAVQRAVRSAIASDR